ncbi:MAG: hypothetical protein MUO54_03305 [Anaerolineales bacterium]|nr:hypothetical protein [Anaerolineales bacterium]
MKKILNRILFALALFLLVIVMIAGLFFIFKPDVVYAMQSLAQIAKTMYRIDSEILSPTNFGKYYSELYWKHNSELIRIYYQRPEQFEELIRFTNSYIHHFEALLEDRGDEIWISQEQVDELEVLLDWIASLSSQDLREDIKREQSRTPLQDFVGLSMNEALDYIERTWNRDFPAIPSPILTTLPTGTVTSTP